MSTLQSVAKAAQAGHGITLQPLQVAEVAQAFAQYHQALQETQMRMEALTDMTVVMIQRLGGKLTLMPEEIDAPHNGFDVNWDEEKNVIKLKLSPLEVPEVLVEDEPAEGDDSGVAQVPDADSGVAEDAPEES